MKRITFFVLLLLSLPVCAFADAWVPFNPSDGGNGDSAVEQLYSDLTDEWNTFVTQVQATSIFRASTDISTGIAQSGQSDPIYTFDGGSYGELSVDFSSWGTTIFAILSCIVMLPALWASLRIVIIGF